MRAFQGYWKRRLPRGSSIEGFAAGMSKRTGQRARSKRKPRLLMTSVNLRTLVALVCIGLVFTFPTASTQANSHHWMEPDWEQAPSHHVLHTGMSGQPSSIIMIVQYMMWSHNYYGRTFYRSCSNTTAQIDGYYGPCTKAAVQYFQYRHGIDTDGVVGYYTWDMLQDGNGFEDHFPYAPANQCEESIKVGTHCAWDDPHANTWSHPGNANMKPDNIACCGPTWKFDDVTAPGACFSRSGGVSCGWSW